MFLYTVVGDNINIMKTTFELNFDFFQAFKQHGYTKIWNQRKVVNLKSLTLITCKLIIREKLVDNQNLNKKLVFIILILSLTTVSPVKLPKRGRPHFGNSKTRDVFCDY